MTVVFAEDPVRMFVENVRVIQILLNLQALMEFVDVQIIEALPNSLRGALFTG